MARPKNLAPCLSCGKDGKTVARSLCAACYQRAFLRGTHTDYPACGAVPVPNEPQYIPHPAAPGAGMNLGPVAPWGAPCQKEWQQAVAHEQQRAVEWLRARAECQLKEIREMVAA